MEEAPQGMADRRRCQPMVNLTRKRLLPRLLLPLERCWTVYLGN
jgi:hypothetical protein